MAPTYKLSLTYADIKDGINNNLAHKDQQAVDKVKDYPKYFFINAKTFSNQKHYNSMMFDENNFVSLKPDEIAHILLRQFCRFFSVPEKNDVLTFDALMRSAFYGVRRL